MALKSRVSAEFWRLLAELPPEIQRLAEKNYQLWLRDPSHPSLHFRKLKGTDDLFTVRIGDHYRAVGVVESGAITWAWIGTHAEYDRLVVKK